MSSAWHACVAALYNTRDKASNVKPKHKFDTFNFNQINIFYDNKPCACPKHNFIFLNNIMC